MGAGTMLRVTVTGAAGQVGGWVRGLALVVL